MYLYVLCHYDTINLSLSYQINDVTIRDVAECANLRALRTSGFQYKRHIDAFCLRPSRQYGMVSTMFATRRQQFLIRLFATYILPIFYYTSIIVNPVEVGFAAQLERIQHRFMRCLFLYLSHNYDDRIRETGLVLLKARRLTTEFSFAYKRVY